MVMLCSPYLSFLPSQLDVNERAALFGAIEAMEMMWWTVWGDRHTHTLPNEFPLPLLFLPFYCSPPFSSCVRLLITRSFVGWLAVQGRIPIFFHHHDWRSFSQPVNQTVRQLDRQTSLLFLSLSLTLSKSSSFPTSSNVIWLDLLPVSSLASPSPPLPLYLGHQSQQSAVSRRRMSMNVWMNA